MKSVCKLRTPSMALRHPVPHKSLLLFLVLSLFIHTTSCWRIGQHDKKINVKVQAVTSAIQHVAPPIVEDSTHAPGPYLTPIDPANLTSCTPQLLGLGAQKAGTDYFFGFVRAAQYHPQIRAAKTKEAHFFSKRLDHWHTNRSFENYLREHFGVASYNKETKECRWNTVPRQAVRAEITPIYFYHPLVPARVQQYIPEARFVVLLRDPAARALSGFNHNWHKGKLQQRNMELTGDLEVQHYLNLLNTTLQREMDTLSTCFSRYGGNSDEEAATAVWRCLQLEQLEPRDLGDVLPHIEMVWRSIYADQLQRWFAVFPPQRFLIWITEDFVEAPQLHMQQLVQWLGLNPAAIHTDDIEKAQEYKHKQVYLAQPPDTVKSSVQQFLKPHTKRLLRVLHANGFTHQAARAEALWSSLA